ncbi:hypothetical protein RIF29_29924 [Crotalaria pallida]|uniref:Uncharacterized protein n=1 Tax=Crotalaria pallida TaxID=3830 RepID=A0AAN9EM87_CROPI
MKSKEEVVADARREKEKALNAVNAHLERIRAKDLKHKIGEEELLAEDSRRPIRDCIFSQDEPVDLNSIDLINPSTRVEDTREFPKDSVVLPDSEGEPETELTVEPVA